LSAVDIALWDLAAQQENLPLFRMLGGRGIAARYRQGNRQSAGCTGRARGDPSARAICEDGRPCVVRDADAIDLALAGDGGHAVLAIPYQRTLKTANL